MENSKSNATESRPEEAPTEVSFDSFLNFLMSHAYLLRMRWKASSVGEKESLVMSSINSERPLPPL